MYNVISTSVCLYLQDLAQSQALTKEIKGNHRIENEEDQIKWILTSDEAGLTYQMINLNTDQNAPLRKTRHIFLREGDYMTGLQRIYEEHGYDFNMGHGKISTFIQTSIKESDPDEVKSHINGGISVLYPTRHKYYLRVITEDDGSIITAYPVSSKEVEWEISIDDTKITDDQIISATVPGALLRETHMINLGEGNSDAGLKHIHNSHAGNFKRLEGADGKEEISKFIKDIMKENVPDKVVSSGHGLIRVIYRSKYSYLTLILSGSGFIITAYPEEKFLVNWKIDIPKGGMIVEEILSITSPDSLLIRNRIIFLPEGDRFAGLRHIYEVHRKEFEHEFPKVKDEEALGQFIRDIMDGNEPADVTDSESGGICVLYPTDRNVFLQVITSSDGCIITASLKTDLDIKWKVQFSKFLVFLRKGHSNSGLRHIHELHRKEFKQLQQINSESEISDFIKETLLKGHLFGEPSKSKSGKITFICKTVEGNYLRVITSSRGSIITAYLMPTPNVLWKITCAQAWIPSKHESCTTSLPEDDNRAGLKHIQLHEGKKFKHIKGIDSEEGISQFIKGIMETYHPVEIMESDRAMNVLYFSGKVYLLVRIYDDGRIFNAHLYVHLDRDHLTWSMTTRDAGITVEAIKPHIKPNALLLKSHVIFLEKARLFMASFGGLNQYPILRDQKQLSESIRTIMLSNHGSINVYFEAEQIHVEYTRDRLHVFIGTNGNIQSVHYVN